MGDHDELLARIRANGQAARTRIPPGVEIPTMLPDLSPEERAAIEAARITKEDILRQAESVDTTPSVVSAHFEALEASQAAARKRHAEEHAANLARQESMESSLRDLAQLAIKEHEAARLTLWIQVIAAVAAIAAAAFAAITVF